jgi:UMF1 family MFS transporter
MGLFTNEVFKKREAWGYIWVLLVRGASWTTWVFTSVAILKYANNSVGCSAKGYEIAFNSTLDRFQTEDEADVFESDCEGQIEFLGKYMTPNTSIPYTASIGAFIGTFTAPIFGSIIDTTSERKLWTFATLFVVWACNAIQIFTSQSNWLAILLLQNFVHRLTWQTHISCVAAFCTEIAEGEAQIVALQSGGRVIETSAMVLTLFAIVVGSTLAGFGDDLGKTASFGQALVTVLTFPFLIICYRRFEDRKALNVTTSNVLTAGFKQLFKTTKLLWKENRSVLQYLVGLSFCDAANSNILNLLPVYAVSQLKLESPALFTGIAMIMCIPGALLTKQLAMKFGIRKQLGNIYIGNAITTILLVVFVYQKTGTTMALLGVAVLYGIFIGGVYPMQKGLCKFALNLD